MLKKIFLKFATSWIVFWRNFFSLNKYRKTWNLVTEQPARHSIHTEQGHFGLISVNLAVFGRFYWNIAKIRPKNIIFLTWSLTKKRLFLVWNTTKNQSILPWKSAIKTLIYLFSVSYVCMEMASMPIVFCLLHRSW